MKLKSLKSFQEENQNLSLKNEELKLLSGGANGMATTYVEGHVTWGGGDCHDNTYSDSGTLLHVGAMQYGSF